MKMSLWSSKDTFQCIVQQLGSSSSETCPPTFQPLVLFYFFQLKTSRKSKNKDIIFSALALNWVNQQINHDLVSKDSQIIHKSPKQARTISTLQSYALYCALMYISTVSLSLYNRRYLWSTLNIDRWQTEGITNLKCHSKVLGHQMPREQLQCSLALTPQVSKLYLVFQWCAA